MLLAEVKEEKIKQLLKRCFTKSRKGRCDYGKRWA